MPITARQRSIHNKNGAKRTPSINKGKRKIYEIEDEYIATSAPSDLHSISYPGGAVALGLLLVARVAAAYWSQISDCDETYNYWEPLHYLVYGTGLQTWEYSPQYAIRSYMPLWLFAVPAKLLSYFLSPVNVFFSLRILLAVLSACAELVFYKAVCHEYGIHVGRVWLALTLPACGMFVSSAAMLPSAWSGALASAALACWWRRRYRGAVFFTAVSTLLSWPFTALLGLPIAIDLLYFKREYLSFIKWSVTSLVLILVPTVLVDSWHYGRLVVAPWNIIAYNIFTEHGPDLYGVEPWTYYFVNCFLNFNIVWVLALMCPLCLAMLSMLIPRLPRAPFCVPYWLGLMPLYLWLIVFMLQPHKEERFLFPVYNLIVLAGAIAMDVLQKFAYFVLGCDLLNKADMKRVKRHYLAHTNSLVVTYGILAGLAGVSRLTALYTNYHAPVTILRHLPDADVTLCYGKEWYRSPSTFHLPIGSEIRFVQSEFDGQMPAPYSGASNATRLIHPYFNDFNKGLNTTYLNPLECDYLIDSDLSPPSILQPHYHTDKNWEIVASIPILNAELSRKLFRSFYLPILSKNNVFGNFYLLKNKLL